MDFEPEPDQAPFDAKYHEPFKHVGRKLTTDIWKNVQRLKDHPKMQEGYNAVCLHKWLDADGKLCYCNTFLKLGTPNTYQAPEKATLPATRATCTSSLS